jgi:hypothetical protein
MSRQQQILSFANKRKKFYNVAGKGLIRGKNLDERFKKMTLGTGAPAHEKIAEELGGSVRHHNRPFQLKDTAPSPREKSTSNFKPIQFKL